MAKTASSIAPPGASLRLGVVNNGTHFLAELEDALATLSIDYDLIARDEPFGPGLLHHLAGFILTGGDVHVYRPDELQRVALSAQLIEACDVPILGICLGYQLMVSHFGGVVAALPSPLERDEPIAIIHDDPLFSDLARRLTVRVAHDDAITSLPESLVGLARSRDGEVVAVRHRQRLVYGVQFHPETSGETGLVVLRNYASICTSHAASSAAGPGRTPQSHTVMRG